MVEIFASYGHEQTWNRISTYDDHEGGGAVPELNLVEVVVRVQISREDIKKLKRKLKENWGKQRLEVDFQRDGVITVTGNNLDGSDVLRVIRNIKPDANLVQ